MNERKGNNVDTPQAGVLGPRQRELLRRLARNHGSLSATHVRGLTRQARSLDRRHLVTRGDGGSVTITLAGKAWSKYLGLGPLV